MFFLHIIIGTVFYRTKNRPGRDNRSKIILVFPLAKAQCGNHPPQGSTADV